MKSLKKKYIYLAVLGTLALFLSSGLVNAAPGVAKAPPINAGNMSQPIPQLRVGNTNLNIGFDVSGLDQVSIFPKADSYFAVFGNFFSFGETWLGNGNSDPSTEGSDTPWTVGEFPNSTELPVNTLNIDGTLMAQSLSHNPTPYHLPICVGSDGILFLCDEGEVQQPTYSCTGAVPTNATMCAGDNANLTANTPNSIVNACTATKCEYTCSAGFVLQGGVCVTEVEIVEETYQWVIGEWGACFGTPASCSGQWNTNGMQGTNPVDWNGDEFNWTDGTVYEADGTIVGYCGINNDLEVGDNMNGMGPAGTACLMVWFDPEFPAGIMYEFSVERNSWDQLTVNASGVVTNVNQNYAFGYELAGDPIVITNTCAGPINATICTSQNQACTWNESSQSQSRNITCQNSLGETVANNLCPAPMPTQTQACEEEELVFNPVVGCYPIEYNELGSGSSLADTFCPGITTKSACNNPDTHLWSQSRSTPGGSTWLPPQLSVSPYPGWEFDYAIHSYGDTSDTLLDPDDLDFDGLLLPAVFGEEYGYNSDIRILGKMCVWGAQ